MRRIRFAVVALLLVGGAAAAVRPAREAPRTLESASLPFDRVAPVRGVVPPAGHSAVLLFITTSCPHCIPLTRYVDSVQRARGRAVWVVTADSGAALEQWIARSGHTGPVLRDSARALQRALLVRWVPTVVALDASGTVRAVAGADQRRQVRALLESLSDPYALGQ